MRVHASSSFSGILRKDPTVTQANIRHIAERSQAYAMQYKDAPATHEAPQACIVQVRQVINLRFLEEGGYFDLPLQVAASQLGVSMTTLKKLCRENSVDRWPFRKRKSLKQVTVRTKQALTDSEETDKVQIQAALDVLEHQRQRMRVCQGDRMLPCIKAYRQQLLKAEHIERSKNQESSTGALRQKLC
ncbi:TPA: hypothetical protein ACH3X1_016475 [Trebouxia sp. C0004]